MADEVKSANSHIALANVGDDLKNVRDNMPFESLFFVPTVDMMDEFRNYITEAFK